MRYVLLHEQAPPKVSVGAPRHAAVLLLEPDDDDATHLTTLLERRGTTVLRLTSATEAKSLGAALRPHLVVMELALPDDDGLLLCGTLAKVCGAPVMVYTHRGSRERVLSLRLGADDAVPKSTDDDEVVARIEAALRRSRAAREGHATSAAPPSARFNTGRADGAAGSDGRTAEPSAYYQKIDEVEIDRLLGRVNISGRPVYLSATEYRLLSVFLSRPGELLTREELADLLFGLRHVQGTRSIDMHVRRLRAKLEAVPGSTPVLPSVRGRGYRLVPRSWSQPGAQPIAA